MKKVEHHEIAEAVAERIGKGAFLTVRDAEGRLNTMTIGWGVMGTIWRRGIFAVLVRPERFTHGIMEGAEDFTVSLPAEGGMKGELRLCGSTSGRDVDKFAEHGLEAVDGSMTRSPVIGGCEIYIECRIVFKVSMGEGEIVDPSVAEWYDGEGKHTIYFGEVLGCYSR